MKKPLPRNEPRHLGRYAWYYVNAGSVDLMVSSDDPTTVHGMTLTRRVLTAMLAELRPIRKRKR